MQRVAIIGCCPKGYRFAYGAGKSTLAQSLGNKLNLPVVHLDTYYWQPGWQETEADTWQQIQQELVKHERWIIDGNYGNTLDIRSSVADTIIWLDFNRYVCLWRIIKRYFKYPSRVRPDMAAECPERLNWEFIQYVWNFPNLYRSEIMDKLEKYRGSKQIIILQKPSQVSNLLQQINTLTE